MEQAEQRNSEGDWEGLTSFDKKKQIQAEGKVKGGVIVNFNSRMLKSNNGGWTERANFHVEFSRFSEANKDRMGREVGKDEKELSVQAIPYGDIGAEL